MNKKKHLTNAERIKIETLLSQGFSIRSIADFLEKSPSTISREIGRHSIVKPLTPVTATIIPDVMSNTSAVLKTVIRNAAHAILLKNTVSITAKEAVNTGMVPR